MIERSPEIEHFLHKLVEAFEERDVAFYERTISREAGALDIATDPDEWAEGYDKIVELERQMMEEGSQVWHVRLDDVTAYREGSVGWGAGRGFLQVEGAEVPYRWTGVVHQEDGEWKAIQLHASIGVPNAEVLNPLLQPKARGRRNE